MYLKGWIIGESDIKIFVIRVIIMVIDTITISLTSTISIEIVNIECNNSANVSILQL